MTSNNVLKLLNRYQLSLHRPNTATKTCQKLKSMIMNQLSDQNFVIVESDCNSMSEAQSPTTESPCFQDKESESEYELEVDSSL